jgi:hypothetical protein
MVRAGTDVGEIKGSAISEGMRCKILFDFFCSLLAMLKLTNYRY